MFGTSLNRSQAALNIQNLPLPVLFTTIPLASWIRSINSLQKPVEFQLLVLNDLPLEMVPGSLVDTPASGVVGPSHHTASGNRTPV